MIVKKIEFDKFKISSNLQILYWYKPLKAMFCPSMAAPMRTQFGYLGQLSPLSLQNVFNQSKSTSGQPVLHTECLGGAQKSHGCGQSVHVGLNHIRHSQ